ncbi:MAG: alpha/beta hydrolase [Urechidicola sp.]|nr:alpha/beta hydrolase [Urechidicola sp.]
MRIYDSILIVIVFFFSVGLSAQEKIEFSSLDGLLITADLYEIENPKLTILLCHQAGYSRGEYINTALQLNAFGYSCMAIDQRSGKGVNSIANQTNAKAKKKGLDTRYLDAHQDIEAAIDYLYVRNKNQPIVIIGSSYSATLVLLEGKENNKVKAVVAFSPGEYFEMINVNSTISGYEKLVYVTASNLETPNLTKLVSGISSDYLTHYKPSEKGIHGSRALWKTTEGVAGYWE